MAGNRMRPEGNLSDQAAYFPGKKLSCLHIIGEARFQFMDIFEEG
jgi:hypothetical protein